MSVQMSIRYQLQHNSVAVLHKFIGPDYLDIRDQSRDRQPDPPGHFAIYGRGGLHLARGDPDGDSRQRAKGARRQSQQAGAARGHGAARPQALQRLPARRDPAPRHAGAQHRVAAGHRRRHQPPDRAVLQIQEYKFRVEREAEESKRKQIEANGIAAFQRTVSQGISESYLRWRGIEATLALAQSPNAKIVDLRHQQGRPAAHSRQCRHTAGFGDNAAAAGKRRGAAVAAPPGAPPAPSDKSSSGAPAPGGGSNDTDKVGQATGNAPPASEAATPGASGPYGMTDFEAILSRLYSPFRAPGSGPPEAGAAPKQ